MRYIIVKAEASVANDGTLSFLGAHKLVQKGSKKSVEWIDIKGAISNTLDPDQCDFLSFEEKEDAEALVEILDSEIENIAIFEVDADQ